jgi:predicted GNAT family acetyltransferase
MMNHVAHPSTGTSLDSPIWTALTTKQAHLGQGDALARRFHPEVAPFAALASDKPAAWDALGKLLQPHEHVALLTLEPVAAPGALHARQMGTIHQMVSTRHDAGSRDTPNVIRLGPADAPEMLDLAQRTKPGPFGRRTHEMGHYIGVREAGRLIAMAGERLRVDGHVEISAVCVDDGWRGKGLAGQLIDILRTEIGQRGQTPFLHVLSHNVTAIRLYERLGFELRRAFVLTQLSDADATLNSAQVSR